MEVNHTPTYSPELAPTDRTPYTYILRFKPTSQFYAGVQGGRHCHPDQLLKTYFTGSPTIKNLIEVHGVEAFEVVHITKHNSKEEAHQYETDFLKTVDPKNNPIWLNKRITHPTFYPPSGELHPRWKATVSDEIKAQMSARYKNVSKKFSQVQKMSAASKGKLKSDEHRAAMKEAHQGITKHMSGFMITRPDGVVEFAKKLNEYCKANNLSQGCMSSVASGRSIRHKGYKCTYSDYQAA